MKCVRGFCYPVTNQGSGVVIGERHGCPIVATCLHNLGNRTACEVSVMIGDQSHSATVIGHSTPLDVAFVSVAVPYASEQAVEIDEAPQLAAAVEMIGFPDGRFAKSTAKLVSRDRVGNLKTNRATSEGQSGGGLFARGRLAGLVKWTDNTASYATPGDQIAEMARYYKVKLKAKSRGIATAPPVPPPPAPTFEPPPTSWRPDPTILKELQQITERLTRIEATAAVPGPAGPTGPAGDKGPPGPPGNAADTSALDRRLTALESRGLTVQLIDENGVVVSEQKYAPGAPVKLRFNPVK